jgi:hypothetical protein
VTLRVIAIDWSGAKAGGRRKIWLAEAADGRLVRLECGRTREGIVEHLIELHRQGDGMIVGLDFAFSMPRWFLEAEGCASAPEWWRRLADGEAARLIDRCGTPFWGRAGHRMPDDGGDPLRRTDRALPLHAADGATRSVNAKSVFQIGGAGAVGTSSIRGMPSLHELRVAGFSIWPFDDPRPPLVVEIYPRLLTGAVTKSDPRHRRDYLKGLGDCMDKALRQAAGDSEDAFDAAVSAIRMSENIEALASLPRIGDPQLRIEGIIWHPRWRETLTG